MIVIASEIIEKIRKEKDLKIEWKSCKNPVTKADITV